MRDHREEPRPVNGVHRDTARAKPIPLDGGDAHEPVDLVAVQADDELINALSAGHLVSAPGALGSAADDRVAAVLAAWKVEVDERPIPELVDLDRAVTAVLAGRPRRAPARHLVSVAVAAALVVLTLGGVSITSHSAEPGDALWPVSKVLFGERAGSVEAAVRVVEHIDRAKQALVSGRRTMAERELERAQTALAAVRPEEGHGELAEVQDFLLAKAMETPEGVPADLDAPLTTQPTRPVPPAMAETPDGLQLPAPSATRSQQTAPPAGSVPPVVPNGPPGELAPEIEPPASVPTATEPTAPTTTTPPLPDSGEPRVSVDQPNSTPTPALGEGIAPTTPTT